MYFQNGTFKLEVVFILKRCFIETFVIGVEKGKVIKRIIYLFCLDRIMLNLIAHFLTI